MINMVFACNGRPIPSVGNVTVKAMYGTEIIEKTKLGTFSNVYSENMAPKWLYHNRKILLYDYILIYTVLNNNNKG